MISPKTLILGANGFVGKELIEYFTEKKVPLRALLRDPKKLKTKSELVSIHQADLNDKKSLVGAFDGIETVYYLVHGMNQKESFKNLEKEQATNVASFLTKEMRVIYLSGLGGERDLSEHLESRHQVGEILRASEAEVIEFRASIIIGAGSLSFELMRGIVERFPVIVNTNWSSALCQPISKNDLITYLVQAKKIKLSHGNEVIEIAGPDKITYEALLSHYAKLKGLKRPVLSIEHLPKTFAQKAVDLFLPEYSQVGKHLLESIEIETTANTIKAQNYFDFTLEGLDQAILESLKNSDKRFESLDIKDLLKMQFNAEELGATTLKDHVSLTLPLGHDKILKILDKAELLSKGVSFLPVKLPKLSRQEDFWRLELPALESSENYLNFTLSGSTLEGIHIFKPKRFFEAETFIIYQKSRDKFLDFFQTIINKFN